MPVASECKETSSLLPNADFFAPREKPLPLPTRPLPMDIEGDAMQDVTRCIDPSATDDEDLCASPACVSNGCVSERSSTVTTPVSEDGSESQESKSAMDVDPTSSSPTPAPRDRFLIVFDWDDTLLCSSFLASKGYRLDTPIDPSDKILSLLHELQDSVIAVLTRALALCEVAPCEVHIITNAETGWVELSAAKFMPRVAPFLAKVRVVSARSTYERDFPESPLAWKTQAFRSRVQQWHLQSADQSVYQTEVKPSADGVRKHVISFGDSHVEREACRTVARELQSTLAPATDTTVAPVQVRTKSVKFADRPSMEQLRRQLDLVNNCFEYIHTHDGDLDLMLTISVVY